MMRTLKLQIGRIKSYTRYFLLHPFKRRKMHAFYTTLLPNKGMVFDIGAHLGEYTRMFLDLGYRVIAVEPLDYYHRALKRIFSSDIANRKLVILKRAVYDKSDEEVELQVSSANPTIATLNKDFAERITTSNPRWSSQKWDHTQQTMTITLDNLIEEYGQPIFCKIDVEGAESLVLQGLSTPLPLLSFEYTPGYMQSTISSIKQLENLAADLGTSYQYNYSRGSEFALVLDRWISAAGIVDDLQLLDKREERSGDIFARWTG